MYARCLPLVAGALGLCGCIIDAHGPTRHESHEYAREDVQSLRLDLHMGAGELNVRGGSPQLARTDFSYNVDRWKPEVRYSQSGGIGDLSIQQPGTGQSHFGETTYVWDLQLSDQVPVELTARLGAGEASMNLGSLSLRRVEVEMGVGELRLDLRGTPQHDYNVRIRGGVGEATIRLPKDVGVYAAGRGGIGEIHTEGFRKQGDHWVNDAFNDAAVRIHVDVEGGVGQINLISE